MEKTSFPTSSSDNAVQRGVESAGSALHNGIDKVAEPVRSTVESLSASAHQTVDALASSASHAADLFSDETRKISQAPGKALSYSKTCVQDRPLEAVGIALALGFIVGRLTAR
jgi:ElaB/YqjD/DUF883 family membrane-anchored ribosome-binding protein